ncbi:hypothetical protein [Corynebacterium aquatimens]|uniref:Alkaline shock response membrane anchor protein AmaP n=1 Tax=Corynebacterium aquatimens TaxID=1190508 RepID=A0A931GUP0_9CORY|nr:hypothetical protein [Corynebacterium aquatimens]MBG6122985.1 hypothetical protein [Corynebacterium aquatimens]WJY66681.1 hypothetical protein CAQUA_09970 [Corynebacterium aquatimens]
MARTKRFWSRYRPQAGVVNHPQPGAAPRANPIARWLTVLLGLVMITLAGLIGHDLWYVFEQKEPSKAWAAPVFEWIGSAAVTDAAVAVGVLVSLIGLWFIVAALKPRKTTHVKVDSPTSMWVRPVDIARKATATGRMELGKVPVSSRASKKKLDVHVTDEGGEASQARLASSLEQQFVRLHPQPQVRVTVKQPVEATRNARSGSSREI